MAEQRVASAVAEAKAAGLLRFAEQRAEAFAKSGAEQRAAAEQEAAAEQVEGEGEVPEGEGEVPE